jgi:hypothetical protein
MTGLAVEPCSLCDHPIGGTDPERMCLECMTRVIIANWREYISLSRSGQHQPVCWLCGDMRKYGRDRCDICKDTCAHTVDSMPSISDVGGWRSVINRVLIDDSHRDAVKQMAGHLIQWQRVNWGNIDDSLLGCLNFSRVRINTIVHFFTECCPISYDCVFCSISDKSTEQHADSDLGYSYDRRCKLAHEPSLSCDNLPRCVGCRCRLKCASNRFCERCGASFIEGIRRILGKSGICWLVDPFGQSCNVDASGVCTLHESARDMIYETLSFTDEFIRWLITRIGAPSESEIEEYREFCEWYDKWVIAIRDWQSTPIDDPFLEKHLLHSLSAVKHYFGECQSCKFCNTEKAVCAHVSANGYKLGDELVYVVGWWERAHRVCIDNHGEPSSSHKHAFGHFVGTCLQPCGFCDIETRGDDGNSENWKVIGKMPPAPKPTEQALPNGQRRCLYCDMVYASACCPICSETLYSLYPKEVANS